MAGWGLIAHADWSVDAAKRWLALAHRRGGHWHLETPVPAGPPTRLLDRLTALAEGRPALLGLDLPLGLPLAYARAAGIEDFAQVLPRFGSPAWPRFYDVADAPTEIGPARPFYPAGVRGAVAPRREHLAAGLGVGSYGALLRACDRATADRRAAACIFWTLGPQQVGKAAIAGWRDLVAPGLAAGRIRLWPFHGRLADLAAGGGIVVAEAYPAGYYRRAGVAFARGRPGAPSGKRVAAARAAAAPAIAAHMAALALAPGPDLAADLHAGFGSRPDGEDRFDALIGLVGMLDALIHGVAEPHDPVVRRVEGWIFGQSLEASGASVDAAPPPHT